MKVFDLIKLASIKSDTSLDIRETVWRLMGFQITERVYGEVIEPLLDQITDSK